MAVWCLRVRSTRSTCSPATPSAELIEKLRISHEELDRWGDITRKMRLCFHDDRILSQFEGYDELEELDWDGLPGALRQHRAAGPDPRGRG